MKDYNWREFWILMYTIVGGSIVSIIVGAELLLR